jgi:hypothetical protein
MSIELHDKKLAIQLYQVSTQTIAGNVHTIGIALIDYFNALSADLSLSNCDDLLHALVAAETAARKLRLRLVADAEAQREQD